MVKFLYNHSDKIEWIDASKEIEPQIISWIKAHLPKFENEYTNTIYTYEEVQEHLKSASTRKTKKSAAIELLQNYSREEMTIMIDERLAYVMSQVKVLETHFVSDNSGSIERTQATPRKDEFNLISVDIFLRHTEHKFLFANPKHLESLGADANHLQQNYIMGFVFTKKDGTLQLNVTEEWNENIEDAYLTLYQNHAINADEMQIDIRNILEIEK